jgi:hypothetical protein
MSVQHQDQDGASKYLQYWEMCEAQNASELKCHLLPNHAPKIADKQNDMTSSKAIQTRDTVVRRVALLLVELSLSDNRVSDCSSWEFDKTLYSLLSPNIFLQLPAQSQGESI